MRWLRGVAANAVPAVARVADVALVRGLNMYARSDRRPAEALSYGERMELLREIRDAYASFETGNDFFAAPPLASPIIHKVRSFTAAAKRALRFGTPSDLPPAAALQQFRAGVYDVTWPSTYRVWLDSVREGYERRIENRTAHARLFMGGGTRPMAIVIHGYMGGSLAFEERAWPVEWLMKLGLDVALFVLPFHGRRARSGPPGFPNADPRVTNEAFGQTIVDLRSLIAWVRSKGTSSVGLIGMSLGGYTASLAATIERDLSFVIPLLPLASVADFARDQGQLGSGNEKLLQHAALEQANRVVSPFARPPQIAPERFIVIAGESDRVTPRAHAIRLAEHFQSEILTMRGGHLLQFGREAAFTQVAERLRTFGIVPQASDP